MKARWKVPTWDGFSPNSVCGQCLQTGAVFWLVVLTLLASIRRSNTEISALNHEKSEQLSKLHFLMPSDKSDSRMCKSMFSTLATGYPSPILINWGLNESSLEMNGYDLKAGKIWGVLQYLRALPSSADHDIVLMSDAYDVWFQLPLETLLSRYTLATTRANNRIALEYDEAIISANNLVQTIIFGAEKFCWPRNHTDPACYAVPVSPLRADAYGPDTDSQEVKTQRPRFLNSGLVIGPVKDMRTLYERVHELWTAEAPANHADEEKANDGDQNIFAEVYGRQEYTRQQLRGSSDWVYNFGEMYTDEELVHPPPDDKSWEFHVGVDFDGALFQALNEAHMDLSFAVHADREQLATLDREHGTEAIYGSTDESFPFSTDLQLQQKPFFSLTGDDAETNALRQKGWADVPLVTNFHARTIPVAIHHNGYNRLLKPWWLEMWWTAAGAGTRLLHDLRGQRDELGAWTTDKLFLGWDELCGEYRDHIFPT